MDGEYEPEAFDGYETEAIEERERHALFTGWGVSLAVHAVVALVLLFVVVATRVMQNRPTTVSAAFENIPPPVDIPPDPDIEPDEHVTPVDLPIDVAVVVPVLEPLEPVEPDPRHEEPVDEMDLKKGMEDALSDVAVGDVGLCLNIGVGGPGANIIGHRRGSGKRRALQRGGGSRATQNGVTQALRWFKRHQSGNGMWDVDGYPVNCRLDGPKCEPGRNRTGADAAVTGYALLCFLGAGYDHRMPSEFAGTVRRGLDWLLGQQEEDGSWGRNYENGVCAMALAEAYAMTNDRRLRAPAQRAVDHLLAVQNPGGGKDAYGGSGWDYTAQKPTRNDSSVTGWCVMALKSAKAAGLDVGGGLHGADWWLTRAWRAANPNWQTVDPYLDATVFPYTFDEVGGKVSKDHLSCVGAACAVFLGHDKGDPLLETLCNDIERRHLATSRAWPTDSYFLYYNTLALFQVGGERWDTWNEAVLKGCLVPSQRLADGCHKGSWDPQGAGGHGIDQVGRTLVTAYACLSLEVYYRYFLVAQNG